MKSTRARVINAARSFERCRRIGAQVAAQIAAGKVRHSDQPAIEARRCLRAAKHLLIEVLPAFRVLVDGIMYDTAIALKGQACGPHGLNLVRVTPEDYVGRRFATNLTPDYRAPAVPALEAA